MFKKRNVISKLWLKYTDKEGYEDYKWGLRTYKVLQLNNSLSSAKRLTTLGKIKEIISVNHHINFVHSGNSGDIIYALATLKRIYELTGAKINFYLKLNTALVLPKFVSHPLGSVMLNQKMAEMLMPLLRGQPYINDCEIYTDQPIHIDLDYFRDGLVKENKGNIARWCGYITGINPDLWKPWLTVEPDNRFKDSILIARSTRYRNPVINHHFLNKYPNLKFIGIAEEYNDMKKQLPTLEWVQIADFKQLAGTIAGCKFFIGNQSFPFSIAEALKVPRILEISFEVINVVPEGEYAYDFLFQDHFEALVEQLYQS